MENSIKQFLSIPNLQSLLTIFHKFLKERYHYDVSNSPTKENSVKKIMFETMQKISNDTNFNHLDVVAMNKVTLSIVKNVMKSKLNDDSTNNNLERKEPLNTPLNRDIILENRRVINTENTPRPISTTAFGTNQDVHEKFEVLNKLDKETDNKPINVSLNTLSPENAMSDDEFKNQMIALENSRGILDNKINESFIESPQEHNILPLNIKDVNPSEIYKFNLEMNEDARQKLSSLTNNGTNEKTFQDMTLNNDVTTDTTNKSHNKKTILKDQYILINSQNRHWINETKRFEYTIKFTNSYSSPETRYYYENNPTVPNTLDSMGNAVPNLVGWYDNITNTKYDMYDSSLPPGNLIGEEKAIQLFEESANIGRILKNIHSFQINKVIIPLNIFLINKYNFNADAINIDSSNKDYDFNVNFPYLLLKINEFTDMYNGVDDIVRKTFCQLVYETSYKCPNGRGYVILKPVQNERRVFYPTALSTLPSLTFSFMKPNGELLNESHDGLHIYQIKNSNINGNRLIQVITNKYFSRNDFYIGDYVTIDNFKIFKLLSTDSDSAINKTNAFINQTIGHEIVMLGDPNVNGYYTFFYIKNKVHFDDVNGVEVEDADIAQALDTFDVELNINSVVNTSNYTNGFLMNLSLQNSVSITVKQQVQDSEMLISSTI